MQTAQPKRPLLVELLIIAVMFGCVLVPFANTILHGVPISKVGMLKPMDAVQAPTLYQPWCILDDLSTSMSHIPNEIFAQNQGGSELALWNQLNGGGRPFVGEFQTLQFSLFHMIFPAADSYAYNLGILFKIVLSATGAYFLARVLKTSSWSALAAGVAFALCPHCLRFAELVDNYCFYPWLALAFVWFAKAPGMARAFAAGLLTAACAYNMHPETFACAAALAAIFAVAQMTQQDHKASTFGKAILWIALIALVAFCAAAPLVLPLVEFIANGSSYKFAAHQIEHIQFADFLANLFLPGGVGNSYFGVVLGLSLPLGLIIWSRKSPVLLAALLAITLFSTRPGLIEEVLAKQPWCYLLPEYTLYASLLLLVLCAASGLDELIEQALSSRISSSLKTLAAIPCLLLLIAELPKISAILPKFIDCAELPSVSLPFVISSLILTVLWLWLGVLKEQQAKLRSSILALLALANSLILVALIPNELGERPAFAYQHNVITDTLQGLGARVIATGYNLFQPNTNVIYGIDDFRSTAPLYPRRYADFLRLGGGGGKFCTIPEAPSSLNQIFDLAGVKYILSDKVLSSTSEETLSRLPSNVELMPKVTTIKLADGLRLKNAEATYNQARRELRAKAIFTLHGNAEGHYACALAASTPAGELIGPVRWLNDRIEEVGSRVGAHQYSLEFTLPISENIAPSSHLEAVLLVRDNWTRKILGSNDGLKLGMFEVTASAKSPDDRFLRLQEFPGQLFLYENRQALPAAYIVHRAKSVSSEAESLKLIADNKTDWTSTVVLETRQPADLASSSSRETAAELKQTELLAVPTKSSAPTKEFARILDRSANSVLILSKVIAPGWLVFTDSYYPGWVAEVDGKSAPIIPANHMFRAVHVEPGLHKITFDYKPNSFALGLKLLIGILILTVVVLALSLIRARQNRSNLLESRTDTPDQEPSQADNTPKDAACSK